MRLILIFCVFFLVSCARDDSEVYLGGGYSLRGGVDFQVLRFQDKMLLRGKVEILLNKENIIFGYLNSDVADFEGLKGPHDKNGYFIVDKKGSKFLEVGNVGGYYFEK